MGTFNYPILSHPNHHIFMNNHTSRRIRHDITIYNTGITQLMATIVVSKGSSVFPTSKNCHDNHARTQPQQGYKSLSTTKGRK